MSDDRGKAFAALRAGQPVSDSALFHDVSIAIKSAAGEVVDAPRLPDRVLQQLTPQERLAYLRLSEKGGR